MRFGCVTTEIGRIQPIADLGFDYIELRGRSLAPTSDEATFFGILTRLMDAPLKVETVSGLIPPVVGLSIVGPSADRSRLRRHTETMLDRCARVGAKCVVLGAGAARSAPEGFPISRAKDQLRDYLTLASELAAPRGLTIAIEYLNKQETNLINSPAEAAALVRSVGRPSLGIAVDHYHTLSAELPLSAIEAASGLIRHVHVSGPDREPPGPGIADQSALLAALKRLGYDGRVSIECRFIDFAAEASEAIDHLRSVWAGLTAPVDNKPTDAGR